MFVFVCQVLACARACTDKNTSLRAHVCLCLSGFGVRARPCTVKNRWVNADFKFVVPNIVICRVHWKKLLRNHTQFMSSHWQLKVENFFNFICTSVFVREYDTDIGMKNVHRNCYFCGRYKHFKQMYKCEEI